MTDLKRDKDAMRAQFKRVRSAIPAEERARVDCEIARRVKELSAWEQADALFAYLSFGSEVDTRGLIQDAWGQGKVVVLPRCVPGTRAMEWHRVDSFEVLVLSPFGVEEPADDPATLVRPDDFAAPVVLVPGLTFDAQGYRMGYGGGFYDVFLSGFSGISVGLCRSCQMSDRIECRDEHDLPVRIVVTESEVMRP